MMKNSSALILAFLLSLCLCSVYSQKKNGVAVVNAPQMIAENNVTWTTLGKNENDSMPIGNGDLAANVWTEANGDLLILLAKADAWAETGNLLKIGRVRIKLSPNPFADTAGFTQTLKLDNGTIEIKKGQNIIRVWADANHPVIHLQAHLAQPGRIWAGAEFWRKTQSPAPSSTEEQNEQVMIGMSNPHLKPDILFASGKHEVAWCHFNWDSCYPYLLRQEHLETLLPKYPDPLFHRCFGAAITGSALVNEGDTAMRSATTGLDLQVNIVAITQPRTLSPKTWKNALDSLIVLTAAADAEKMRDAHIRWWTDFWGRSWVHVAGNDDATKVSTGYAIQRYMMACSSRGEMPVKYNGGLFTVGHNMAGEVKQIATDHDPDFRAWGESFWNQNNRLLYWPLIATGDTDLIRPWFNMYTKALAFQKDRNKLYYQHEGASYPETMQFWGIPRLPDFGKDNPTNEIASRWQRYHVQGTLEVIAQMLDVYDNNPDASFAKSSLVPFADAIITYYDQHWKRDGNGKILMSPMQSLETYQLVAVNPTPDIAGLMSVIPRLLALPTSITSPQQRDAWGKTLKDLPPLPLGTTAKGKLPPLGQGDPDGMPTILPAEKYGKPGNSENPELYVTFPYRLYGVGKPGLDLIKTTFNARRSPQNTCWGQDGTEAAVIGLTDVAQKAVLSEFTNYGDQRFLWFWKAAHDWIPDLDNGGDGMITLQNMLMQCDGKRIQLLAAWPQDWTADFKLHAPYQTIIEGHVKNGKIIRLSVIPKSRTADVTIAKPH